MRTLPVLILLIFSATVKSQMVLPGSYIGDLQRQELLKKNSLIDSTPAKKWFVSRYAGISSSVVFSKGGNATILSVPVGIQLNRRLTNNWSAFAGISVAPSYVNFNRAFMSANTSKYWQPGNGFNSNRFDMYSRAEMGLMYTNDQKTFSISGSIGVERSSYPWIPINQVGITRPNTVIPSKK